jgi:hypothetical protein
MSSGESRTPLIVNQNFLTRAINNLPSPQMIERHNN